MSEQDLDEWLEDVRMGKAGTINFSFPTDKLKSDYIETISQRTDSEISDLLRKFLIPSGSLGSDQSTFSWLVHSLKDRRLRRLSEFQKRLIIYAKAKVADARGVPPPWEGVTWILDLLPDNPRAAIDTLNAYFEAHCLFMPDGRMHGIADATEIIRVKYIQRPRSSDEALRLLLNESPRTFEYLVERLYSQMGYATKLTPCQLVGRNSAAYCALVQRLVDYASLIHPTHQPLAGVRNSIPNGSEAVRAA